MHGPALRILRAGHEAGALQHLEVFGHSLDGDVVRLGELADGGVADGEPGHDVSPRGIGESREQPGQRIGCHCDFLHTVHASVFSTIGVLNHWGSQPFG